jgi:hypothetical protein
VTTSRNFESDERSSSVFAGRETARDFFVLLELGRLRAEQLAQRIIDLQPRDADGGRDRQQNSDDRDCDRIAQ